MAVDLALARVEFERHFGRPAEFGVRAPGRVNIIGEHTDYNGGFVLPMAIERETLILARRRPDPILNAYAASLGRAARADLREIRRNPEEPWVDYLVGVAHEVRKLGHPLNGADVLVRGDVPVGAGLSSSASLEMATLALFEALGGFSVEGADAPKLGRRVENEFIGVNSGIMDQFVIRLARAGHALFLDCRTLEFEHIPAAFSGAVFVVADTAVSRGLGASKYNERVAECAEAVRRMNERLGREASQLRDFTPADVEACRETLPDAVHRRARHIVTENERTLAACEALRAGNLTGLGGLMNASDHSLRDDYEVTCPELDAMTRIARGLSGCYGTRMTGAGFGGCTVNLVDATASTEFAERLLAEYAAETGLHGKVLVSSPAEGASRLF